MKDPSGPGGAGFRPAIGNDRLGWRRLPAGDLIPTHLTGETNTLYENDGSGMSEDRTEAVKLAAPSFPFTGFGGGWLDLNNAGRLDFLVLTASCGSSKLWRCRETLSRSDKTTSFFKVWETELSRTSASGRGRRFRSWR